MAKRGVLPIVGRDCMPTPSWHFTEQTVTSVSPQALRAARDRERAELRALIARRRRGRALRGDDAEARSKDGGDNERQDKHPEEQKAQPQEWNAPSGWAAAVSPSPRNVMVRARRKLTTSEPPPTTRLGSPNSNRAGVVGGVGRLGVGSASAGCRRHGSAKVGRGAAPEKDALQSGPR